MVSVVEQRFLLIENVYEEIAQQQGSLATDKTASKVLEKLLRYSNAIQVRKFALGLQGYCLFLCAHRFGSHVLETFLVRAMELLEDDEDVDASDATVKTPTLARCVCGVCDEVK